MEFSIYSSDVRDFDERVDRKFDISDEYGKSIFCPMTDRLIPSEQYEYAIEPCTYLGVLMDMQQQINDLKTVVDLLGGESEQS